MGIFDGLMDVFTGGNSSKAADFAAKGASQFDDLGAGPSEEDLASILQGYVLAGELSPEQAQAYLADPSAMTSISTDPALRSAQMNALQSLQDLSQGGLSAQDKADLSRIATQEQAQARGAREAILQNAAEKGAPGSGLAILNQMKANQDAASNQSQRDLDVAGMAQQRALQALQGAGNLAGNIQNQDFSQQAQIAAAKDAIAKFNAGQRQQIGLANQSANNQAAATNLANRQKVADSQIDARNQTAKDKGAASQQVYQNALAKASGKAGAYGNAANQATGAGQGFQNLLGSSLIAGATLASDRNLKEDVEPFDASKFLDSITGYRYNYKQGHDLPKENQVGVMAQDVEKEAPQLVEDTPEGKMIDYNKAGGPIFASLADLNRRLKELEG